MISADEALEAWGKLAQDTAEQAKPKAHRHYRPLVDAAQAFVREAQDQHRIFLGMDAFDEQMRGIGSGHLCVITGYSHSGKTQFLLKALRHNKNKRIAFFIPDEPATLILSKLASVQSGVDAREIEARVARNDPEAIELLRNTALVDYPNLAVFDKPLTPDVMEQGYNEVTDVWGEPADLVIVDYIDLVQAGETVQAKFDYVKGFGSRHEVPIIAIHQTSRSAGADGRKMTISSGNYGGEQHATFLLGVRRKKAALLAEKEELLPRISKGSQQAYDRLQEVEHELAIHQYTITVNLVKNKRPGGGLVDDLDLEIDTDTGRLYTLRDGELPGQHLANVRNRPARDLPLQPVAQRFPSAYEGEF